MMNEFRKKVLKVSESRNHRIRNSNGVYDAYKWIRKNKWLNIGRPLKENEFYSIIRKVNDLLADNLVKGKDVILPCRMGRLELRKWDSKIYYDNGKVKTNLPVDWDATLNLWAEDEKAYKDRTLIKMEEKEIFTVLYNKSRANYNNKSFYEFEVNRDIKKRIKKQIKAGAIDAFKL